MRTPTPFAVWLSLLLTMTFAMAPLPLVSQGSSIPPAPELEAARLQHERRAMLVLGGWAVANIGLGLSLRGGAEGSTRHFHEMNALWNTVNLSIAGVGYYLSLRGAAEPNALASLQANGSFQKTLLFNTGLDVGYIMGGLYLLERSRRPAANEDRLRGFGRSIVLQGSFLFVFDLVNYFIANGRDGDYRLLFGAVGEGMGLRLTF